MNIFVKLQHNEKKDREFACTVWASSCGKILHNFSSIFSKLFFNCLLLEKFYCNLVFELTLVKSMSHVTVSSYHVTYAFHVRISYLSVFSPNVRKFGTEKLWVWTLFTKWTSSAFFIQNQQFWAYQDTLRQVKFFGYIGKSVITLL